MTQPPFVTSLRSRPGVIQIGDASRPRITLRVEMPEVWDTVRVQVPTDEPISVVKERALSALYPNGEGESDFVLKLNGYEVLDEDASIAQTGAVDGSTFLLTLRRRRPVHS
jgi:hypothetical protein